MAKLSLTALQLVSKFLKYQRFCETVEITPTEQGFLTWYENQLKGVN